MCHALLSQSVHYFFSETLAQVSGRGVKKVTKDDFEQNSIFRHFGQKMAQNQHFSFYLEISTLILPVIDAN